MRSLDFVREIIPNVEDCNKQGSSVNCDSADANFLVTDPDNDPLAFELTMEEGGPSDIFKIDDDGIIKIRAGARLNFEDGQSMYSLTLRAFDHSESRKTCPASFDESKGCFTTSTVFIKVADANDPPVFPSDLSRSSIQAIESDTWRETLTGSCGQPFAASDPDGEGSDFYAVLEYMLKSSPAAAKFTLSTVGNNVKLRLACVDDDGAVQDCSKVDCNVQNLCQPVLDFETAPKMTVGVVATDGRASAQMDIEVSVIDVNEAPSCAILLSGQTGLFCLTTRLEEGATQYS